MTNPRLLSDAELIAAFSSLLIGESSFDRREELVDGLAAHIDALTEERDRLRGLVERAVPTMEAAANGWSLHTTDDMGCHLEDPYWNGEKLDPGSREYAKYWN